MNLGNPIFRWQKELGPFSATVLYTLYLSFLKQSKRKLETAAVELAQCFLSKPDMVQPVPPFRSPAAPTMLDAVSVLDRWGINPTGFNEQFLF